MYIDKSIADISAVFYSNVFRYVHDEHECAPISIEIVNERFPIHVRVHIDV